MMTEDQGDKSEGDPQKKKGRNISSYSSIGHRMGKSNNHSTSYLLLSVSYSVSPALGSLNIRGPVLEQHCHLPLMTPFLQMRTVRLCNTVNQNSSTKFSLTPKLIFFCYPL